MSLQKAVTRYSIAITCAVGTMHGCTRVEDETPIHSDSSTSTEPPCVVLWRYSGHRANPELHFGLEFAVWKDGTLLISPFKEQLGKYVLVGKADPKDVTHLLARAREAGAFDKWESVIVVDADSTHISLHDGPSCAQIAWTESLLPGFGGDISTDKKYRSFVRMWNRTRGAIEELTPFELKRLEEVAGPTGTFRGHDVANPWKTTWRP